MKKKLTNILLIDDDDDNNFINKIIIREAGWKTHLEVAQSAKTALNYLTNGGNPELIFLDINMPVLSGWDFIKEYKNLPISKNEHLVIVMLTSSINMMDENKARSIKEIAEYLNKPLTEEMLKELRDKYFNL